MKTATSNQSAEEERSRNRELVAVVVAGLLIGGSLGWWGERTARGVSAGADAVMDEPAEIADILVEEEGDATMRAWMEELAAMGRRVIPEHIVPRLAFRPLDAEGRVSEAGRELFLLTGDEIERLNQLVGETTEQLVLAEMMYVEIVALSDYEAVFLIPALMEGMEIRDALRQGLIDILGESDGELFWTLLQRENPDGSPDRWRGFGQKEREIRFALSHGDPVENGGEFPRDAVAGWLLYEERVTEESLWFPEEEVYPHLEVERVRTLPADDEVRADDTPFFAPRHERYGFLVPLLPENLRPYFQ